MHRPYVRVSRLSKPPRDDPRSVSSCRSTRGKRVSIAVVAALCAVFARAAADPGDMPNVKLTPGTVATENVPVVCRSGYARSVRPDSAVWRKLKDAAYNRYGLPRGHRSEIDGAGHRHAAFAIDHLICVLRVSTTSSTERGKARR